MQVYDNIRAGNLVTNGNTRVKDDSQNEKAWGKFDENGDGIISFSKFVSFKEENSSVNGLVIEHSYVNKYEQMMKELEAVEKEMNEDIERKMPRLV